MRSYSPELIQTMRAALDELMTKIPLDQATPGIKAHMAEFILKTAAEGQTSYDALLRAASDNIQNLDADVNSVPMGHAPWRMEKSVGGDHGFVAPPLRRAVRDDFAS